MNKVLAFAAASSLAGGALAQNFEISMVAPMTVGMGETYTVEVWASVTGYPWVDGVSAFAGFGIDAIGTGDVVAVTSADLAVWAMGFGNEGVVLGPEVHGISGGQLANLFGGLNPNIDLSNPILLFSIDVTAANAIGSITYTPDNPNANGGLSFYPNYEDGASVVAPNDPGTTLTLTGVTTTIIPAPATLAFSGLTGLAVRRRRKANLETND